MAIPTITPLPQAPSRSDGPVAFNALADPFIAALPPFVLQANALGAAINDALISMGLSVSAAAGSASAAATSANAANSSKNAAAQSAIDATNNGAAQVALAADQVALAVIAKNESQAAAQAAGAAAGLPGGRVPYTVLQVNAGGNVVWGDGLIERTPAVPGQALMLGTGKVPKWDFPGHQVGDILFTSRDPGALFLPANGSIRSQSAYPALFAKLGLIGGSIGTSWPDLDIGTTGATGIGASTSGTVIVAQTGGKFRRSTDRGLTWADVTVPINNGNVIFFVTDNVGTWICAGTQTQALRSTDDGLTWQIVTLPSHPAGGGYWSKPAYCGNGTWIVGSSYHTALARSTDNGVTWSSVTHGYPIGGIGAVGANSTGTVLIAGYDGSASTIRKSTDYGATWSSFIAPGQVTAITTDRLGTWVLVGISTAVCMRSLNDAASFSAFPVPGASGQGVDALIVEGLILYMFNGTGGKVWTYQPNGTFVQQASANVASRLAYAGGGVILSLSATALRIIRSSPVFGYDTATQFALPTIPNYIGVNSYVKAKELA